VGHEKAACASGGFVLHPLSGASGPGKNVPGIIKKNPACRGEFNAAMVPGEQSATQLPLEIANLHA
jgi:hypothetical protein